MGIPGIFGNGTNGGHVFRFFRVGGFDQVLLESGEDLANLDKLDPKLWVALACPVKGLEFDEKTLSLIDSDGDGRIRVPEVAAAVKWAVSLLKNPGDLTRGAGEILLSAVRDDTPEGAKLLESAREILKNLEKPDSPHITVEDAENAWAALDRTRLNGDGIVPPDAARDPAVEAAMRDIMDCVGSETDMSGEPGLSQELVERFFEEAAAHEAWWKLGEADAERVFPLGEETERAFEAFSAVRVKITDYFTRSRLAACDERAAAALGRSEADYAAVAGFDLAESFEELARFPLARIAADRPLPLSAGLNPYFAEAVRDFAARVVTPLLGELSGLSYENWRFIVDRFAAHEAWRAETGGPAVAKLGRARVREILDGPFRGEILSLIESDRALSGAYESLHDVERLARYHRDLFRLLLNFVSFSDFYTKRRPAVFQAGTLYLDGRSMDLCVRVDDPAKHASLAGLSRVYLLYCDCARKGSEERMTIAAAVTDGDADQLLPGRNGVFYDRLGQDWDATVTKIVEHPISIRQAFSAPYKRLARMMAEQVEKFAAGKEKAVHDSSAAAVSSAGDKAGGAKPPAKAAPPFDAGRFAGIFAAIGLALGAIGTAVASVVTGFMALKWYKIPFAIAGILLVVSGPSMLLAWLKLRQRTLGPLLDASGWAVNTRARINIPFGRSLTSMRKLPPGAARLLTDPYAEKRHTWAYWLAGLLGLVTGAALVYWRFFAKAH